jgi:hypothetical protein
VARSGCEIVPVSHQFPLRWLTIRVESQWSQRRVIYATPQSFMIDMAKGRVDPKDIVLLIIGSS